MRWANNWEVWLELSEDLHSTWRKKVGEEIGDSGCKKAFYFTPLQL